MRLHRFFISEPVGAQREITIHSADLVNQVRRVFRLKVGDLVVIFDGSGSDYTCKIEDFGRDSIRFSLIESSKSRFIPSREIILCAAVVKKDIFEWIVEKATELGVARIIPVIAERSEKKGLNEGRLKKIAVEASEQSGRGNVPEIRTIAPLGDALVFVGDVKSVTFHTDGDRFLPSDLGDADPLAVFIGPEGGWSPDEIDLFRKNDIPVYSLGSQILRAETAVVAALSKFLIT